MSEKTRRKKDGHEANKKSHGRLEERYTTVIYDPEGLPPGWPEVAAVILVGREREVKGVRADTSKNSSAEIHSGMQSRK